MKESWIPISAQSRQEWEKFCPTNTYKVIHPSEAPELIPGLIPVPLLKKFESILVLSSGSPTGIAYCMLNGQRKDGKFVDQEPFGFSFIGQDSTTSGCFIHHGDWINRTYPHPQGFSDCIIQSGIGFCLPLQEMPTKSEGPLDDLKKQSHQDAFENIVKKLVGDGRPNDTSN